LNALNNKKIVFFFPNLELGGAERQALLLTEYIITHTKAKVVFYGFKKSGSRLTAELEKLGIQWGRIPEPAFSQTLNPTTILSLFLFALRLRRIKADIFLPYTLPANVLCGAFWKITNAKACIWNQRDEGIGFVHPRLLKASLRHVSYFIANSRGAREFLLNQGVSSSRITVVRNGILPADHLEHSRPNVRKQWRDEHKIEDDTFVACMVANLHTHKDHLTLLKAWRIVKNKFDKYGQPCTLILAGRFDNTHLQLKAEAFDLNLCSSVLFPGQVQNIQELLYSVDLYVHSSKSESSSNAVLEAMAAGLAVTGTDIAGIRDAICDENQSFLAPVADASKLADCIWLLAQDKTLRYQLGARNKARIEETYSLKRMGEETCAILVEMLQRGN
jgi:glycosyltransferase involved in cell wall biosynthesis